MSSKHNKAAGYTLIELMITVMIVAILAAIALPNYQQYVRKNATAAAQQEMLKLAEQLERHRAKNFTFKCFNPAYLYNGTDVMTSVTLPVGDQGNAIRYTLTLVDRSEATTKPLADASCTDSTQTATTGLGQQWAIRAERNQNNNLMKDKAYNLLLTSTGVRCMTTLAVSAVSNLNNYTGCNTSGNNGESW